MRYAYNLTALVNEMPVGTRNFDHTIFVFATALYFSHASLYTRKLQILDEYEWHVKTSNPNSRIKNGATGNW